MHAITTDEKEAMNLKDRKLIRAGGDKSNY